MANSHVFGLQEESVLGLQKGLNRDVTPLRYVKKCRNLGQTLEFLKDFCYKPNQPGSNNSQILAFLESELLNNGFLNTPKGV